MIEVLKQALDALKDVGVLTDREWQAVHKNKANELRQAIKDLESQEPVALPCCGYTDASAVKWNPLNGVVQCHNCGQNYTTSQRTWVGLTNNELQPIADEYRILFGSWVEDFARAIEAKLKEKNT